MKMKKGRLEQETGYRLQASLSTGLTFRVLTINISGRQPTKSECGAIGASGEHLCTMMGSKANWRVAIHV
jgi:hypothetical protein